MNWRGWVAFAGAGSAGVLAWRGDWTLAAILGALVLLYAGWRAGRALHATRDGMCGPAPGRHRRRGQPRELRQVPEHVLQPLRAGIFSLVGIPVSVQDDAGRQERMNTMAINDNFHICAGTSCGCSMPWTLSPFTSWPFPVASPATPARCPATTRHTRPHSTEITGLQCKYEPGHEGDHAAYTGPFDGDVFWPQDATAPTASA